MSLDSIASSTLSASSMFQSLQGDRGDRFKSADADASGGISLEEFTAVGEANGVKSADGVSHEENFAALDADGDGQLNMREIAMGGEPEMDGLSSDMMSMLLQMQEQSDTQAPPPPPPPPSDDSSSLEASDLTETLMEMLTSSDDEEEDSYAFS